MSTRRTFCAASVAFLGAAAAGRAATVAPPPLSLLVAGPPGEAMDRWGEACARALAPGLPGSPQLNLTPVGGLDGVTGANRLDAFVMPDGRTAAILPGTALIAWAAGDDRVHFDPTHWVPVLSGLTPGVFVLRDQGVAPADAAALRAAGGTLRLGAAQAQSDDLAALLALERMGVPFTPVFGLNDTDAKTRAFATGQVDAVFLSGEGVPEDLAPLSGYGGRVLFSIGQVGADGRTVPDPLFPALPDAVTFSGIAHSPLDAAYQAAAAAVRLDFLLVLPKLTGPNAIAPWTAAAANAVAAPALAAAAAASSLQLAAAPAAASDLSRLAVIQGQQPELQAFLVRRFGVSPG